MLFGRDAERARLEQLLDGAASGPVGCILQGKPGIGKTTVWRAAVESARQRGYQVLETAPSEPDSVLAFSGLNDLLDRISDGVLETLPDAQADAMRAALLAGDLPNGSRDMQALPRAVLGVLRALAAAGPVLIAIDDEQWLDPASARVLAFALCRLHEEAIVGDPRAPAGARKHAFDGARTSLRRPWTSRRSQFAPLPAERAQDAGRGALEPDHLTPPVATHPSGRRGKSTLCPGDRTRA